MIFRFPKSRSPFFIPYTLQWTPCVNSFVPLPWSLNSIFAFIHFIILQSISYTLFHSMPPFCFFTHILIHFLCWTSILHILSSIFDSSRVNYLLSHAFYSYFIPLTHISRYCNYYPNALQKLFQFLWNPIFGNVSFIQIPFSIFSSYYVCMK